MTALPNNRRATALFTCTNYLFDTDSDRDSRNSDSYSGFRSQIHELRQGADKKGKGEVYQQGTTMRPGSGSVVAEEKEEEVVVVVDSIDGLLEAFGCVTQ